MIIESHNDVVYLSGSMLTNHWQAVLATANLVLERYPRGIIIDCSEISFASPAGAQTISDATMQIKLDCLPFTLRAIPQGVVEQVWRAIEVSDETRAHVRRGGEVRRVNWSI